MSNIYFTSDTHYGHTNIASKNSSSWKGGYRHYSSLHEMNIDLVKNINKTVGEDDTLYHLGDWSFGGKNNIWSFRKQIDCKNIHLILGNHDHHIENNIVLPNVHQDQYGNFISSSNSTGNKRFDLHARDLFDSVSSYKEITINGRKFVLFHYGMRVWHGSHKGWFHLYGHSHDTLPAFGRSIDVGVDSAIRILGEARPFSLNEITQILENQPIKFVDHHGEDTNP